MGHAQGIVSYQSAVNCVCDSTMLDVLKERVSSLDMPEGSQAIKVLFIHDLLGSCANQHTFAARSVLAAVARLCGLHSCWALA